MRLHSTSLILITIITSLLYYTGEGCLGGGGITSQPPTNPNPTTGPGGGDGGDEGGPGSTDKFLGDGVKVGDFDDNRYTSEGGGPVVEEGLLDCDFEGECCWHNAEPPEDKLQWQVGSGTVDADKLSKYFGTSTAPNGAFLTVVSPGEQDPFDEARFDSCSISCTNLPVTVSLNHWTTEDVELQVCSRDAFYTNPDQAPLLNCQTLPRTDSPGPSSVTLPPDELFDVVIVARNFLQKGGGAAIVDDVKVEYTLCPPPSVSTEAPDVVTTPSGGNGNATDGGSEPDCQQVVCGFENGNPCGYVDGTNTDSTKQAFTTKTGRFMNRVTGISGAADGAYYSATYLKPGQSSSLSADVNLQEERQIKFKYYEATEGIRMRGCCDSESDCKFNSDVGVQATDRQWKDATFICPASTTKLLFLCDNQDKNEGACGIDSIEMFVVDESQNPTRNACPNSNLQT